jgi:hypothetical protein
MPTLSDRFSAYPASVTLDGSGNGTLRFQATGKAIAITNLYASVATQTSQAKCTIYKGQIGPQWAINTTNSGSTGSSAHGNIELLDGEAVYVVWTGGDAGAIATATFTGYALPFNYTPAKGGTDFTWEDPIAAGDGSIIYPALKSPNFVAGVSGWRITRNGDAEFNGGTFRGGVDITGSDGSRVIIQGSIPGIEFIPPPTVNIPVYQNGRISAGASDFAVTGYGSMSLNAPIVGSGNPMQVLIKQGPDSGGLGEVDVIGGSLVVVDGTVTNADDEHNYGRGENGQATVTLTAASSGTQAVVFNKPFLTTPTVVTNIQSGNGLTARWYSRALAVTTTGFNAFCAKGDAADPALTFAMPVDWIAIVNT